LNVRTGYAGPDHRADGLSKRLRAEFPHPAPGEAKSRVHGNILRIFKPEGRASAVTFSLRKEVIQPQVLLRLPCYDFTPIMSYTLGGYPLAVGSPTSSTTHFRDVTGGVYKARERIHRSMLICDY
jgi:hypothetical protein